MSHDRHSFYRFIPYITVIKYLQICIQTSSKDNKNNYQYNCVRNVLLSSFGPSVVSVVIKLVYSLVIIIKTNTISG